MTEKQLRYIRSLVAEIADAAGLLDAEVETMASMKLGFDTLAPENLTRRQASKYIDWLKDFLRKVRGRR